MADDTPKGPTPRWLTDEGERSVRVRRSRQAERGLAARLGGRTIAASGAKHWSRSDSSTMKGDISTPSFHVEHKQTERSSLSLKYDWLKRVREGATRAAKDPMLVITFERTPGRDREDYVVIPLDVFERCVALREMDENED